MDSTEQKRQENFENRVLCEADLHICQDNNGNQFNAMTLDDLGYGYYTLSEISSYGKDASLEDRNSLKIIINERMDRLNDIQREIAELRYIEHKSFREIREVVNRSISTIHYHISRINEIIRSI